MGPQIKFFLNKFQLLPCSVHSVCRSLKSNTNAQTILCTWMALQNANAPSIFQSKHIVIIHNCTTQPTHHITSLSLSLSLSFSFTYVPSLSQTHVSLSLSLSLNTCLPHARTKSPESDEHRDSHDEQQVILLPLLLPSANIIQLYMCGRHSNKSRSSDNDSDSGVSKNKFSEINLDSIAPLCPAKH